MSNKYYDDIRTKISSLIEQNNYEEANKFIIEELKMPYIPSNFEEFLLEKLATIPKNISTNNNSLSLEKIVDILLKLDNLKQDQSDIIQSLKKFNLNNSEDLKYYFDKSNNKRNRATIFELLINEKADLECELGNSKNKKSIFESDDYKYDEKKLIESLEDMKHLIEIGIVLLRDIYLTKYYTDKNNDFYYDVVLYTMSKILNDDTILYKINYNFKELKLKVENVITFENL